jgi:uncharacterized protein (AIM24 family)
MNLIQFVADGPSTVVLGPDRIGEVGLLHLDGTKELIVKTDAFLVAEGDIDLSVAPKGFGVTQGGFFHLLVRGTGNLGISSYGGMVSLSLDPKEECIVEPK